jgi:hypothetical protein
MQPMMGLHKGLKAHFNCSSSRGKADEKASEVTSEGRGDVTSAKHAVSYCLRTTIGAVTPILFIVSPLLQRYLFWGRADLSSYWKIFIAMSLMTWSDGCRLRLSTFVGPKPCCRYCARWLMSSSKLVPVSASGVNLLVTKIGLCKRFGLL